MTMVVGSFRSARRLKAGGTISTRVEDVAPQPAGGGVAPRIPVVNEDERGIAMSGDLAMHETQAELTAAGHVPAMDDMNSKLSALVTETRPAFLFIIPP
jgi:hypothetical protein